MIGTQHTSEQYDTTKYSAGNRAPDVIAGIYRILTGDEYGLDKTNKDVRKNQFTNMPLVELLEIVDELKLPLDEKVFDGEPLSEKESRRLELLEDFSESILDIIEPEPERPKEVLDAIKYAERLLNQ